MKVCIHRGSHEIGGNCIEVAAEGASILLDAGLPLQAPIAIRESVPAKQCNTPWAVLISHGHADHFGLVGQYPSVPVHMGCAARRIIGAASRYLRNPVLIPKGPALENRKTQVIGPFSITPYLVDHSAYDAYALHIESGGRSLFYTGDFRFHGRKADLLERLITSPPHVDTLLIEGTTIGRAPKAESAFPSEEDVEHELARLFGETSGLALLQASPQNIDRVVSIYRACRRSKRTLVIDLYAAEVLAATENPRIPQSTWPSISLCLPRRQRIQVKNEKRFDVLADHARHRIYLDRDIVPNPEGFALLFSNAWRNELEGADCLRGAALIYSQWAGYREGQSFADTALWLARKGIPIHQVHASGHADVQDLLRLARAFSAKQVVPIHCDAPEAFAGLLDNVTVRSDGEWWDV